MEFPNTIYFIGNNCDSIGAIDNTPLTSDELEEFTAIFNHEMKKDAHLLPSSVRLSDNLVDVQYQLSSIVTHIGARSTDVGHYVADVLR